MQYDINAAIEYIKSQKGTKSFTPDYDISQGVTAWRFSDLAIAKGYTTALWYAEIVRDRVADIPQNCNLLITFSAFCEAEKQTITT
jgi:hypothetical protein